MRVKRVAVLLATLARSARCQLVAMHLPNWPSAVTPSRRAVEPRDLDTSPLVLVQLWLRSVAR